MAPACLRFGNIPQGRAQGRAPVTPLAMLGGGSGTAAQDPSIPSHLPWGLFWFFYSSQLVKTRTSKIGELSNYVR